MAGRGGGAEGAAGGGRAGPAEDHFLSLTQLYSVTFLQSRIYNQGKKCFICIQTDKVCLICFDAGSLTPSQGHLAL